MLGTFSGCKHVNFLSTCRFALRWLDGGQHEGQHLGQGTMRAESERDYRWMYSAICIDFYLSATEICRNFGISVSQKTRPLMKKKATHQRKVSLIIQKLWGFTGETTGKAHIVDATVDQGLVSSCTHPSSSCGETRQKLAKMRKQDGKVKHM